MKVEKRQGKWLFVAENDDENNAIASLVSLLGNSNCCVSENEANDHGHAYSKGQPRNYVYIPNWDQLNSFDDSDT